MTTAEIIRKQISSGTRMATGARNFGHTDNGIRFNVRTGTDAVSVTLSRNDTYTLRRQRFNSKLQLVIDYEVTGIMAEQLNAAIVGICK